MKQVRWLAMWAVCLGVALAQQPTVNQGGVVNAASFAAPNAPGSLVSIFGTNLAANLLIADTIPLSTRLGDVSVTFNAAAAPMVFAVSTQVNAQLPWNVDPSSGAATVVVTRGGNSSPPQGVQLARFAPAIYTVNQRGFGYAIAQNDDFTTLAAPAGALAPLFQSHPAKIGHALIIYANGLGAVDPPVADGHPGGSVLHQATTPVTVLIGGVSVPPFFAGVSPQFPGVNQINVIVPQGAPTGDAVPLRIRMGDTTTSDQVTIAVSN